MAIDGATVVIGARHDDDGGTSLGSVYVFRTSDGGATYDQVAKLTAADAAAYDSFGYSVAIDGATVVIFGPSGGRGNSKTMFVSDGHMVLDILSIRFNYGGRGASQQVNLRAACKGRENLNIQHP